MNNSKVVLTFPSLPENESFARSVVTFYAMRLNPSVAELSDIKTAVSEAVTNSIVHGYPDEVGEIVLESEVVDGNLHINVFDRGIGIENVEQALEPFFTTKPNDERSGMGFTVMKSFMDEVIVKSEKGKGTSVYMVQSIGAGEKGK